MDMTMKDYVNWKMSHDVKYGEAEGYPLMLEKCRNNKELKDYKIYGNTEYDKNLLDVNAVYPDYVNDEGGITYTNKEFAKIHSVNILKGGFKEKTQYTLSFSCEITDADNNGISVAMYDASGNRLSAYFNFGSVSGNKSGSVVLTNNANTLLLYCLFTIGSVFIN